MQTLCHGHDLSNVLRLARVQVNTRWRDRNRQRLNCANECRAAARNDHDFPTIGHHHRESAPRMRGELVKVRLDYPWQLCRGQVITTELHDLGRQPKLPAISLQIPQCMQRQQISPGRCSCEFCALRSLRGVEPLMGMVKGLQQLQALG